jgi:hypothetical protein
MSYFDMGFLISNCMRLFLFNIFFFIFLIKSFPQKDYFNNRIHVGYAETAYSVIITDSGFVVSAGLNEIGKKLKLGCVFIDKEGDFKNIKIYEANNDLFPGKSNALSNTKDKGFILATTIQKQSVDYSIDYLMRFNSQGDTLWAKTVGDSILFFKLSSAGDSLWWRNYYGQPIDSTANNYLRSIKSTNAGGIVGAGFVTKPQDIWIFKVDSMGCEIPLCHVDTTVGIIESAKKDFAFKVYPNPSAGLFNFEYDLLGENEGRLSIYNALGAMVKQEKLLGPAGKMQVEINGSSGSIFFYTFELKGAIVGKGKLILVK